MTWDEMKAILIKTRLEKELSQVQVTRLSGLSKCMVTELENSRWKSPNILTVIKWVEGLGLELTLRIKPRQQSGPDTSKLSTTSLDRIEDMYRKYSPDGTTQDAKH